MPAIGRLDSRRPTRQASKTWAKKACVHAERVSRHIIATPKNGVHFLCGAKLIFARFRKAEA
jgi:hypothetical protein